MINLSGLFGSVAEWLIDLFTRSNGLDLPDAEYPKLEDRVPYPKRLQVEIPSPINDAETIAKREAANKEFWEIL